MTELITYFNKNQASIMTAIWQHVVLSLISLIIAIVIALPLAVVLFRHKKLGEAFLQATSTIQTIPSLAILGLLIPFVGIGTAPAVIALVLYALMPIFSNSYTGLREINPDLMEVSEAFGLSKTYQLFKVQLPLAFPYILAGIRQAMVMIIGTATLAALIGGGGLGTFILLGIQTNNNQALLIGAVLAALLALLANGLLYIFSKLSVKRFLTVMSILVIVTGVFFIGHSLTKKQTKTVIIGGKMGGEPEILINMYKDVIEEDNPNVKVVLKPNFGGTTFLFNALKTGKIDIYPEFTGTVLQSLTKTQQTIPHQASTAYQLSKKTLLKQDNLSYLAPMQYQNGYGIAVTKATAQKYQLKSISDLAKHPELIAAFDPDFYQQSDGYPGLQKTYGLNFDNVKMMEPSLRYAALKNNQVAVTDAYTTDPQIHSDNLVILEDDQNFFQPYQAAPLMKASFKKQNTAIAKSLEKLSNHVTTVQMQEMNEKVTINHEKVATVAKNYLKKEGLIS